MKTTKVTVELTDAQLRYLNQIGYHLRAKPGDLLPALAFAYCDMMDGDDRGEFMMKALVNYVTERRLPTTGTDVSNAADAGVWVEKELKIAREVLHLEAAQ